MLTLILLSVTRIASMTWRTVAESSTTRTLRLPVESCSNRFSPFWAGCSDAPVGVDGRLDAPQLGRQTGQVLRVSDEKKSVGGKVADKIGYCFQLGDGVRSK